MDLTLTYDAANESSRILACHWYLTVRHTIPARLEYAAGLLGDAIELAYRYELDDAFEEPPERLRTAREDLLSAARRIREAAARLDAPEA